MPKSREMVVKFNMLLQSVASFVCRVTDFSGAEGSREILVEEFLKVERASIGD